MFLSHLVIFIALCHCINLNWDATFRSGYLTSKRVEQKAVSVIRP